MTSIFIKTFGCSHNFADSEEMAYYLSNSGYTIIGLENITNNLNSSQAKKEVDLINQSDIIIYNTCTVKNPSDDKFFTLLKRTKKPVILAGCIPQSQVADEWLNDYSAIGVDNLDLIVEVVEGTLNGEVIHRLKKRKTLDDRELPIIRRNSFIAIIPILQGCLGSCTYCKTKHARGHLKSYSLETILKQVRKAKLDGVKEIWIVSEDNGAYGKDIDSSLPKLLDEISNIVLSFDIVVRVGMLNPEYAYEYKTDLARILKKDCFYKFLHIPIQCADDDVLFDMKRPYTVKQFDETFKYLKNEIPNLTLATDIICGFPTESDSQFEKTLSYLKKQEFNVINISKFYPRPKTPAAKMKILPTHEVKKRSKKLSDWFSSVNFNTSYVGKTLSVLFLEKGSVEGSFIGKTINYRNVVVKSDKNILGMRFDVKILSTTRDDLRGEIINKN